MRFLIAVLVAALIVPLAARPALGATAGGDPAEAPADDAAVQARLEHRVLQAQAARNAALLPEGEVVALDLVDLGVWLVTAAATLGISLSEIEAETLLSTAATDQGGEAAVQQAMLDEARRRLMEVATVTEDFARAPTVAPSRSVEGAEKWRDLVARYFPPNVVDEAVSVMQCESEGDPTARNRRSGATGLFQFLRGTWQFAAEAAGVGHLPPTDPEANVAAAAWLVSDTEERGIRRWAHWTCRP
jgi:hypothetical protein